jgi:hypothetical protein
MLENAQEDIEMISDHHQDSQLEQTIQIIENRKQRLDDLC